MTTGISLVLSSSITNWLVLVKVFGDVIRTDAGVGDMMWEAVTELARSGLVGFCVSGTLESWLFGIVDVEIGAREVSEQELVVAITFMDALNNAAFALRIQSDDPSVGELMMGGVREVGSRRMDSFGDDIIISADRSETLGIGLWDLVPDMVGCAFVSILSSSRGVTSDVSLGVTPICVARSSGTSEGGRGTSEIDSSAKRGGSTVSGWNVGGGDGAFDTSFDGSGRVVCWALSAGM
jgi:hypothetical protein